MGHTKIERLNISRRPSGSVMTHDTSAPQPIVFVVDDDASVRSAVSNLLESVGIAARSFATPPDLRELRTSGLPCCMILDVRMPGLSGLDYQSELVRTSLDVPIIFMTGHGDIPMTVKAMKAGAMEFLTKPFRDQEMLDAVYGAMAKWRTSRAAADTVDRLRASYCALSAREQCIMERVVAGLMNKQIAGELGVSEITVKVHRGNVMRKMGAKTLPDLVRMSEMLGLASATK